MAVLGPSPAQPVMINDLALEAATRCENRVSMLARATVWVRDTLVELTSDTDLRDDFDELETFGLPLQLVAGQVDYPFNSFLSQSNEYGQADYNLATLDVVLWTDPPANSNRIQLRATHYQEADKLTSSTRSVPAAWYRFGDNIGFSPIPNNNYTVQARILRGHPINDAAVPFTAILLERDWYDVLVWGAVERGYLEIGEFDKAQAIHTMLHGDPKYPARLGLLQGKKKRRMRESFRQSSLLRPVVRRYGFSK